jgi:hypothetical protein
MAVLQQSVAGRANPFSEQIGQDIAPTGTWVATIVDVCDEFGIVRPKFEHPNETETVDLATFLFEFLDEQNVPHLIASKSMRISGNEKAALYGFLKSILGVAPKYGWDYCEIKGAQCLLTVEHKPRRDGSSVFPMIATLSPIPASMRQPAPAPVAPAPAPVPAQRAAPVAARPVAPAGRPVAAPRPAAARVAPVARPVAPAPAPAEEPLPF